jgi:hypothetical protein
VISNGGKGMPSAFKIRRWHVALVVVAAIVAGSTAFVMRSERALPVTTMAASGADGVFARGIASTRSWQLAVEDIAGPGYPCVPGVTLNGADADPVIPAGVGKFASTEIGTDAGFAFIQVAAGANLVWLDPVDGYQIRTTPVAVTACGQRFRLAGFAYPLTATLRLHVQYADRSVRTLAVLRSMSDPQANLAEPQVAGMWQTLGGPDPAPVNAVLATGQAVGGPWSIQVTFGQNGDCFTLASSYIDNSANARPSMNVTCGPVSTPDGPDLVMALPLTAPADNGPGIGYALSLEPGTSGLIASMTGGQQIQVHPVVVDGRQYAAFFVPAPLRLTGLTFITAHGRLSTSDLPGYGYIQFWP